MKQTDWNHHILNEIDPALVESAAAPAKKHSLRPVRIAVAAACLCGLLVGGAFAATQIAGFKGIKVFENLQHDSKSYDGYSLLGGCRFISLDELSPEIRELSVQNPAATVELSVRDLTDFEALTGLELTEIPSPDGLSRHQFTAYLTSDQSEPTRLSYTIEYRGTEESSLRLFVYATAYTEQMEDPEFDISVSYVFPSGHEFSTEQYITDNGVEILLTHSHYLPTDILFNFFGTDSYYADFSFDGIIYHLASYCPNQPDHALHAMRAVLEGFHL